MKTKEFIKKVEELGYKVRLDEWNVYLLENEEWLVSVNLTTEFLFVVSNKFNCMKYEDKKELFEVVVEYAKTPIAEREEEKKYYIRPKTPTNFKWDDDYLTLNYDLYDKNWCMNNEINTDRFKTAFTKKELLELGYKLSDFQYCEVGTDNWVK